MTGYFTEDTHFTVMCGHVTIIGNPSLFGHGLPKCADAKVCEIGGVQYLSMYDPRGDCSKFHHIPLGEIRADMFTEEPPTNMRQIGPFVYNSVFYKYTDMYYAYIESDTVYYADTETHDLFDCMYMPIEFTRMTLTDSFEHVADGDLIIASHFNTFDQFLYNAICVYDGAGIQYLTDYVEGLDVKYSDRLHDGGCNYYGPYNEIDNDIGFCYINNDKTVLYYFTIIDDVIHLKNKNGRCIPLTEDITEAAMPPGHSKISIIVKDYDGKPATFGRLNILTSVKSDDLHHIYYYTDDKNKEHMFVIINGDTEHNINFTWAAPNGANTKPALPAN